MRGNGLDGLRVEEHPHLPLGTMMLRKGREILYTGPIERGPLFEHLDKAITVCLSPADYASLMRFIDQRSVGG